jgi:hypothetical protein
MPVQIGERGGAQVSGCAKRKYQQLTLEWGARVACVQVRLHRPAPG